MERLIKDKIIKYENEIKEIRSKFKDKKVLYRIKLHVYEIQLLEARISELNWLLINLPNEPKTVSNNEQKKKVCNDPLYTKCTLFYQSGCNGCPKFH